MSPQNSHVDILTHNVMGLGGGAFGRWLSHEGGDVMNGISTLIKETPESLLTPSAMCCSVAKSRPTLCMDCSTPGSLIVYCLPELAQTHVHWVGDAIQLSHPLSSPPFPAFNLSQDQVFSNELAHRIRWPSYLSFTSSINPSNVYSGLISFRIDWFNLLAVQGTLKSLLQHHNF